MTAARWQEKADQLWEGWKRTQGVAPPNFNAIRMVLAHAQREDHCGDDWDGYGGWGCCDLRALSDAEKVAFAAGTLRVGMWLYADGTYGEMHRPDSIGTIRGDSDPSTGPFHVWFAAFPRGPGGPGYMLRAGIRGTVTLLDDPTCKVEDYASSLYVDQFYYGGIHPTAAELAKGAPRSRGWGKRARPLNESEEKNVADYIVGMKNAFPDIDAGLKIWTPPNAYSEPAPDAFVEHDATNLEPTADLWTGRARRGEPIAEDEAA